MTVINASLSGQEKGEHDYMDLQTWLLGDFSYNALLNEPHDSWFDREFNNYTIDDEAFIELGNIDIDSVSIRFIGVDSYKEAPVYNYDLLDIERVPTFIPLSFMLIKLNSDASLNIL